MKMKNINLHKKRIRKNKKAVSELIAYVILISLAVSLSSVVYLWLRFYVQQGNLQKCPDEVSVILKDYNCLTVGENHYLNLTIKNTGYFSINGTVVFIDHNTGGSADDSLPSTKLTSSPIWTGGLIPGETKSDNILYPSSGAGASPYISKIALLPYRIEKGKIVYCDKAVVIEKTSDASGCPLQQS
jgi:hypothetical protein